jgi:hypothetical protein
VQVSVNLDTEPPTPKSERLWIPPPRRHTRLRLDNERNVLACGSLQASIGRAGVWDPCRSSYKYKIGNQVIKCKSFKPHNEQEQEQEQDGVDSNLCENVACLMSNASLEDIIQTMDESAYDSILVVLDRSMIHRWGYVFCFLVHV